VVGRFPDCEFMKQARKGKEAAGPSVFWFPDNATIRPELVDTKNRHRVRVFVRLPGPKGALKGLGRAGEQTPLAPGKHWRASASGSSKGFSAPSGGRSKETRRVEIVPFCRRSVENQPGVGSKPPTLRAVRDSERSQ
jgi:hypothetical protein